MTTYVAYDSTEALDIPAGAWAVMGYSDGEFQWPASAWATFSRAWRIPITVLGLHDGARIVDCEPGAVWPPAKAAKWLADEAAEGRPGTLYGTAAVHAAIPTAGFARILADYDGVSVIPPGYVGKQYADAAMTGKHYDLTVVDPLWVMSVAAGGPPSAGPVGPGTVATVQPNGPTTDLAGLRDMVGLSDATVVTVTANGSVFTTDMGTLRGTGLV